MGNENEKVIYDKGIVNIKGVNFQRYTIKTHLITVGEDIEKIVEDYALPHFQDGDILCISEKILAICQKKVVYKKDVKVGRLAKFLSKYVHKSKHGYGLRDVYNMQIALDLVGPVKILFAAFVGVIGKVFGKPGLFYVVVGQDVRGIDGCLAFDKVNTRVFDCYLEFATLNPSNPDGVCNNIKNRFNIDSMIIDANDLDVEMLGSNADVADKMSLIRLAIKDNPAGQSKEQTPMILVRPAK